MSSTTTNLFKASTTNGEVAFLVVEDFKSLIPSQRIYNPIKLACSIHLLHLLFIAQQPEQFLPVIRHVRVVFAGGAGRLEGQYEMDRDLVER